MVRLRSRGPRPQTIGQREHPVARAHQPCADAIQPPGPHAAIVAAGVLRTVVQGRPGHLPRRVGDQAAARVVDAEARVAATVEPLEELRDRHALQRVAIAERGREDACLLHEARFLRLQQPVLVDPEIHDAADWNEYDQQVERKEPQADPREQSHAPPYRYPAPYTPSMALKDGSTPANLRRMRLTWLSIVRSLTCVRSGYAPSIN